MTLLHKRRKGYHGGRNGGIGQALFHPDHVVPGVKLVSAAVEGAHDFVAAPGMEINAGASQVGVAVRNRCGDAGVQHLYILSAGGVLQRVVQPGAQTTATAVLPQIDAGFRQAAEEYPDIAFALLNGAESTPEKAANGNVASLLPNAEQIGWIAGALAGLMTESGKLGFIGGMELDTTKGKIAGFEAAAKYVGEQEGKTVELLAVPYANSFSDAPKGKEFATELISQGADVFFGDASAVDSGAREAIDAANEKAGAIKIYDIGQPADILGQNPCIICSQVTDNAAMIGVCMEAVVAGTFGGNTIFGTLENGALSAGAINTELVPAEKVEKYNAYLQQMMDGTFMK